MENREPIFVIGYPKSGCTWLARLIAEALDSVMVGGENAIDQADKRKEKTGKYLVYKSHFSEKSKPSHINETKKIVYIVRDFRDILVSGFFHTRRDAQEQKYTIENSLELPFHFVYRSYLRFQIKQKIGCWRGTGLMRVKKNIVKLGLNTVRLIKKVERIQGFSVGNWSEHVNYWTAFPGANVIRYEDLLSDPFENMHQLFEEMRIEISEQRLISAIEHQSFKVRKKEFLEAGDGLNAAFLRKGAAGEWKRFLDEDILRRVKTLHGPTMIKFGYDISEKHE